MIVKSMQIKDDPSASRRFVWLEGSQDGWNTKQVFCDLYDVSGVIVAINPLNHRPMFVVKDDKQLKSMITKLTGFSG